MKATTFAQDLAGERPASYELENLLETRRLGRVASCIAVPLLAFFIWQDLAVVGIPEFLPSRLASLGLFLVSGLVLFTRRKVDRAVMAVHGLALLGLIAMNCHLIFVVLVRYPSIELHRTMVLNALSINLFATYLLAGGLRRFVALIASLPLLVLVATLLAGGAISAGQLTWFSNPLMIIIVITGLSLAQERARRREFDNLRKATLHLNQLEAFMNAITESALLIDLEGRVVLGNETAAGRLGLTLQELLGRSIWDLLPSEVVEHRRQVVEEVKRTGKPLRFEDHRGEIWFDQVITPVHDGEGSLRFLAIFGKDISASKRREEELVYLALHDPLTGLANRRSLEGRLDQALGRARRGYPSCLLFVDLDHFKEVNDQCGHATGDRVLKAVSRILAEGERYHDAVFRIGGDEFAILLEGIDSDQALIVAERVRLAVAERGFAEAGDCKARLGISIGCVAVKGCNSVAELLKLADEAMYRAKKGGRNRVEAGQIAPEGPIAPAGPGITSQPG